MEGEVEGGDGLGCLEGKGCGTLIVYYSWLEVYSFLFLFGTCVVDQGESGIKYTELR